MIPVPGPDSELPAHEKYHAGIIFKVKPFWKRRKNSVNRANETNLMQLITFRSRN
jgi:hypothetical protein